MHAAGSVGLEGRVAIVTGVGGGLGEALAHAFLAAGVKVAGIGRQAVEPARFAASTDSLILAQGDIADMRDCSAVVADCMSRFGRVDILVNNAAVLASPALQLIEDSDPDDFDRVLEVNVAGAANMCRAVFRQFKAQRDGVILNVASVNALLCPGGSAAYNASKAALVALTKTLAVEGVDFGVRANSILLGATRSEMVLRAIASRYEALRGQPVEDPETMAALNRHLADPADVASAMLTLCRPEAALITGSEIAINGAMTAGKAFSLALQARWAGVS